jgi:integrase
VQLRIFMAALTQGYVRALRRDISGTTGRPRTESLASIHNTRRKSSNSSKAAPPPLTNLAGYLKMFSPQLKENFVNTSAAKPAKIPWNKGKIVGQKAPLKLKDIWAIRIRLQLGHRTRELALFDLGLDSKLRACDLVRLRVRDICQGGRVSARAIVMQQKTARPVQFEITQSTRDAITEWIKEAELSDNDYLFPSRVHDSPHLGTRQYARILDSWIEEIGLDPTAYGTHTMRRTKASLIYRRTKNIRAVQLLLGHTKLESTVRYLGIEVEDALELSEKTEI